MKPKLYMETTIPSYLTAHPSRDIIVAGHQQITWEWWQKRKSNFDVYVSQFVLDEANAGDPEAAQRRLNVLADIKLLNINEDVTKLAKIRHYPSKSSYRCSTYCCCCYTSHAVFNDLELYSYC